MVSLSVLLSMFVILFGIIGGMRGWAKELLVSFSVILSLFLIVVLEKVTPFLSGIVQDASVEQFWLRAIIVTLLVFFGYQTPNIGRLAGTAKKERISDSLLGIFLGAINGYLIFGTLWYFMDQAEYPFKYFVPPNAAEPFGQASLDLINKLPPAWLGPGYGIFLAVGLAFLFVLVVFI